MRRVQLVLCPLPELPQRVAELRSLGFQAATEPRDGKALVRELGADPPAAVIIDLTRSPSTGRDIGLGLRTRLATRALPLVFVGGTAAVVARIHELLPDAVLATWAAIGGALERAIANPPADPVVPESVLAGYSGTPLPVKLGIKPDTALSLIGAPADFVRTLGELPPGATVRVGETERGTLTIWFVRSRRDLDNGLAAMARGIGNRPMWISWPKKSSALAGDLGEADVRAAGLAAGLVDYKVCAIDDTWSGLLFTRRRG